MMEASVARPHGLLGHPELVGAHRPDFADILLDLLVEAEVLGREVRPGNLLMGGLPASSPETGMIDCQMFARILSSPSCPRGG